MYNLRQSVPHFTSRQSYHILNLHATTTMLSSSMFMIPHMSLPRSRFALIPNVRFKTCRVDKTHVINDGSDHCYTKRSLKNWDNFYKRHQNKFFKDRHYLEKDWGQYFSSNADDDSVSPSRTVLFEVGCGAGNTIFPLLAEYPKLFVHACDFSPRAVSLVKSNSNFSEDQINVFVCDIANDDCEKRLPSSVDVVTLIFMLSAVSPSKMPLVLCNIKKVLKPNGHILVRDYAVGDFAQVKLETRKQMISENFYFRGDGTLCLWKLASKLLILTRTADNLRIIIITFHFKGAGYVPFSASCDSHSSGIITFPAQVISRNQDLDGPSSSVHSTSKPVLHMTMHPQPANLSLSDQVYQQIALSL